MTERQNLVCSKLHTWNVRGGRAGMLITASYSGSWARFAQINHELRQKFLRIPLCPAGVIVRIRETIAAMFLKVARDATSSTTSRRNKKSEIEGVRPAHAEVRSFPFGGNHENPR